MNHPYVLLSWLLFLLLGFSLISLLVAQRQLRKKKMLVGVQLLQAGRILVNHIQRHRGWSIARLSGLYEEAEQLPGIRARILADMERMAVLDEWFAQNQNWQGITAHWASLSSRYTEMSVATCFDQHCRLVAALLELVDECAEHYKLNTRYSGQQEAWKEFLYLGELMGQCRGLGMQLLSRRAGEAEAERSRRLVNKNLKVISLLLAKPNCTQKLGVKQKQELEHFVAFVQEQLFDMRSMVSASHYFDVASDAMELIYQEYDREITKLLHRVTV